MPFATGKPSPGPAPQPTTQFTDEQMDQIAPSKTNIRKVCPKCKKDLQVIDVQPFAPYPVTIMVDCWHCNTEGQREFK